MKNPIKVLSLLLALLTVLMLFAACGDKPAETTRGGETKPDQTTAAEPEIEDTVPKDLSYKSLSDDERTITFYVRNNLDIFKNELCVEELDGDILNEAVHYRNIDVENRLGVKFNQITQTGSELTSAEWNAWNEVLSTAVLNNTHEIDATAFHSYCGSVLATQNIYMNLYTCDTESGNGYIDLGKPWWNQLSIDELSYAGALFMMGGSLLTTETQRTFCIYFNKKLFSEQFAGYDYNDFYKMSNDGDWTIDQLILYAGNCYVDNGEAGEIDDGDVVGWKFVTGDATMSTWVYAMGLKFTERDEMTGEIKLSYINDPQIVNIFEKVQELYGNNPTALIASSKGEYTLTDFSQGNVLFTDAYLAYGADLRDTTIEYGILPIPKLNEEQENYYTNCVGHASMLGILSNLTPERTKMVTATIEVMAAETYKQVLPVYYSKVLQGLYSKDQPDAEQYDKILTTVVMDLAYTFFPKGAGSLKSYTGLFKHFDDSFDLAYTIDANKTGWETALETFMTAMEDAADKSFR